MKETVDDKPTAPSSSMGNQTTDNFKVKSRTNDALAKTRKLAQTTKKVMIEEEPAEEEAWWPEFTFDSSNALCSKLSINLRNCQYDLFRRISLNELGWRVLDHKNRVLEPGIDKPQVKDKSPIRDRSKSPF